MKATHPDMLSYQYQEILSQLSLTELHAVSPNCPCNFRDLNPPEFCLAKHCLTISALAHETALMDSPNAPMLYALGESALVKHEQVKGFLCEKGDLPIIAEWSREWRKKVERLYYVCSSKMRMEEVPVCMTEVCSRPPAFRKSFTAARPTYPDGRLIPQEGDPVYQVVPGPFGSPASIEGVVNKRGRVEVVGSSALIGMGPPKGKTYPLTEFWTVEGDPEIKRREEAKKLSAEARKRQEDERQAEYLRKTQESVAKALREGHLPLVESEAEVGDIIVEHLGGIPRRLVITELDEKGRIYARPEDVPGQAGGSLGPAEDYTRPAAAEMAMPAPFGWPGGKKNLKHRILALIPPHKTYVEPFAGAASVFWAKEPSETEVLNDLDADLMRFYKALPQLQSCNLMKEARDWGGLRHAVGHQTPCQFLANVGCSFGTKPENRDKTGKNLTRCINNAPQFHKNLPQYRERLRRVKLHNEDWEKTVRRYDAPDTFIYLDPPYYGTSKGYVHSKDQLGRLAQVLPTLKGKWLLSYDDDPEVRRAFSKFHVMPVVSNYTLQKGSNIVKGKQLLIANYPLEGAAMKQEEAQDLLLTEIAGQVCTAGLCSKPTSAKPVCTAPERKKLERCVLGVKEALPQGCGPRQWRKPIDERPEGCYNPHQVCSASVGCRLGRAK